MVNIESDSVVTGVMNREDLAQRIVERIRVLVLLIANTVNRLEQEDIVVRSFLYN